MTGLALLGLMLISMGWLFFLAGLAINYRALRGSRRGIALLPGVVGSVTVFFTLAWLRRSGLDVRWPWLWILLPMTVDPCCVPGLIALLLKRKR